MLVLTRFRGQRVLVGDNCWVTVVEIRGNKVRLGFDAPVDVPIHREEHFDQPKEKEGDDGEG